MILTPEQFTALLGVILVFIGSILTSLIASWFYYKRVPAQNLKDKMDAADTALKMAQDALEGKADYLKRLSDLENVVNNSIYDINFRAKLGEYPEILGVTIRRVPETVAPDATQ